MDVQTVEATDETMRNSGGKTAGAQQREGGLMQRDFLEFLHKTGHQ